MMIDEFKNHQSAIIDHQSVITAFSGRGEAGVSPWW
jgi:hypothetical protein